VFLLVLAHPGSPGQRAVKRLLYVVVSLFHLTVYSYFIQNAYIMALKVICNGFSQN